MIGRITQLDNEDIISRLGSGLRVGPLEKRIMNLEKRVEELEWKYNFSSRNRNRNAEINT